MICIVALFIFGVLSIFSAKYRSLTREAFDCVFRKLTFRTCETKLDERIRSKVTSKLIVKNAKLAGLFYKRFELISWIFTILFFSSMIYSAYSLYNLYIHGTCDPYSESCPFDLGAPICGCGDVCFCELETCNSPEYLGCEGNCACQQAICVQG